MAFGRLDAAMFEASYVGTPPWDIGRAQPAIVSLAESGEIAGSILDVGCGTGEHALFLRAQGLDAWGIDVSARAIEKASAKAHARGMDGAIFRTGDALELGALGRTFDMVIDTGVLHVFSDADRLRYASSLAAVLEPGCVYLTLVFSDREPREWGGPRRLAETDFARVFERGWRIVYVRPAKFETNMDMHRARGGSEAWLARIERIREP